MQKSWTCFGESYWQGDHRPDHCSAMQLQYVTLLLVDSKWLHTCHTYFSIIFSYVTRGKAIHESVAKEKRMADCYYHMIAIEDGEQQ